MNFPSRTLAALLVAGSLPLMAGSVQAAPLTQSLALKGAETGTVEQVQYRRGWRSGRWIGPAAGFAAGVAIGSALAPRYYDDGYYAYGAAPGYVYEPGYVQPAPRYYQAPGYYYGAPGYDCSPDRDSNTSNPSWACR